MITAGFKRLVIECATSIAVKKADADRGDAPLHEQMVEQLRHLSQDCNAGLQMARDSVAAVRGSNDYSPTEHGVTDDEIADYILARVNESRRKRSAQ